MKKSILILCCLLPILAACGQKPAAPTQAWCEYAFQQIPDHQELAKVDSAAFSSDFYSLLQKAYALKDREQEMYPGELGDWEFLFYWYAGNGESPLEDPAHTITYEIGEVQGGKASVDVTIHTPSWAPDYTEYHRFTMPVVYEDGAWRIDDWQGKAFGEDGFSMKKNAEGYISRAGE